MSGNTQKESYYLTVTYSRGGSATEAGQSGSESAEQEKAQYFYLTENRLLAEKLVKLFNKKLGQYSSTKEASDSVVFGMRPSSAMDEEERFLIDEHMGPMLHEVSSYTAHWFFDVSELGDKAAFEYDPSDPPLYKQDEPLSSVSLHHQAEKWEQQLRPIQIENGFTEFEGQQSSAEDVPPPIDTQRWSSCKSLTKLREIDSNPTRKGIEGTRKNRKDLKAYLKKHKRLDIAETLCWEEDRITTTMPYRRMFLKR